MVLLVTSDNEQFTADKDVVERSVLIKNMLEGMLTMVHLMRAVSGLSLTLQTLARVTNPSLCPTYHQVY